MVNWSKIGWWITFLITVVGITYTVMAYNGQQSNDDKTQQVTINKSQPKLELNEVIWDYEGGIIKVPISNTGDSDIFTKKNGAEFLVQFELINDKGDIYYFQYLPSKIGKHSTEQAEIDIRKVKGDTLKISTSCKYVSNIKPNLKDNFECSVEGDITKRTIDLPKYHGLKILIIDATRKDDNIEYKAIREYLENKGSNVFVTQSPGRNPGEGVIAINSRIIPNKKVGYLIYNDSNQILSGTGNTRKFLKTDFQSYFTHLSDGFEVRTFTEMNSQIKSSKGDVYNLLYWIGDCNLASHKGCGSTLFKEWTLAPLYTQNMLTENKIDALIIVPIIK